MEAFIATAIDHSSVALPSRGKGSLVIKANKTVAAKKRAGRSRLSKGLTELALIFATSALHGRAGPVTFGICPKSNQKQCPYTLRRDWASEADVSMPSALGTLSLGYGHDKLNNMGSK